MRMKSLTPEQMEDRVARFKKLQTYQRQNFEMHNIPPGAVEKVAARRVYPVMTPADYQGRSARRASQRSAWPNRQHRRERAGQRARPAPPSQHGRKLLLPLWALRSPGSIRVSIRLCWSRST